MKKLICATCLGLVLSFNSCLAVEYTDEQKEFLYDVFYAQYVKGINASIDKFQIDEKSKEELKVKIGKTINKQDLIDKTWGCLKAADPSSKEAVTACFQTWAQEQQSASLKIMKEYLINNYEPFKKN